nr:hypothetical protein [Methylobacterium sp. ZNC0032]
MNEDEARERWEVLFPLAEAFRDNQILGAASGSYAPGVLKAWLARNEPAALFETRDPTVLLTAELFIIPRWNALALGNGLIMADLPPWPDERTPDDWLAATRARWLGGSCQPAIRDETPLHGGTGRPTHLASWPPNWTWRARG